MRALLILFAVLVACQAQAADPDNPSQQIETKLYGNCLVSTRLDMFTDESLHEVGCLNKKSKASIYFAGDADKKELIVMLNTGTPPSSDAQVSVTIRIDKGELIRRDAPTSESGFVYIRESDFVLSLLHDIARGQRVSIRVGNQSGIIPLEGSNTAIADFLHRTGFGEPINETSL